MVLPETTPLPSHLAGLTLMPGTVLSSLVLSIMALSEFCANTPMEGIEKTGTAGISPALRPGTAAVALGAGASSRFCAGGGYRGGFGGTFRSRLGV